MAEVTIRNAFTVDLEDWFHPELVRHRVRPQQRQSMIAAPTREIMKLLNKHNTKGTFFVLGDVGKRNPDLIREIYSEGHEIASHGMSHRPLWDLDKDSFAKEMDEFDTLLKNIIGKSIQIKGYRAPSFSLDNSTRWALDVLKERGYLYDSSVFPFKNMLYGLDGAPLEIYRPSLCDLTAIDPSNTFFEFPVAVCDVFGLKIPVGGGFYFRAIPFIILKRLLRNITRNRPFVFYLHPWECDNKIPRVGGLSPLDYFITYCGIHRTLRKLEAILGSFSFAPISEVLGL